jgi:hypothetical protein
VKLKFYKRVPKGTFYNMRVRAYKGRPGAHMHVCANVNIKLNLTKIKIYVIINYKVKKKFKKVSNFA